MPQPLHVPESPITKFFRALKASKALAGMEVLPGAASQPMQTAPGRIVIFPTKGDLVEPGDRSVSVRDDRQLILAQLWGKGTSSGAADEAALADWDATWDLLVRFLQALEEQAANEEDEDEPGLFFEVADGPSWDTGADTSQQGTSIELAIVIVCPIPAAAGVTGHVGDNWNEGTAEAVAITGAP